MPPKKHHKVLFGLKDGEVATEIFLLKTSRFVDLLSSKTHFAHILDESGEDRSQIWFRKMDVEMKSILDRAVRSLN